MKVLVCGSRYGFNQARIRERLAKLPGDATVIEGGAAGVDTKAREIALALGLDVIEIPANWVKHGKAAGPIRNRRMLEMLGKEALVIAFHENIEESKGTRDTVTEAQRRGIAIEVISS